MTALILWVNQPRTIVRLWTADDGVKDDRVSDASGWVGGGVTIKTGSTGRPAGLVDTSSG